MVEYVEPQPDSGREANFENSPCALTPDEVNEPNTPGPLLDCPTCTKIEYQPLICYTVPEFTYENNRSLYSWTFQSTTDNSADNAWPTLARSALAIDTQSGDVERATRLYDLGSEIESMITRMQSLEEESGLLSRRVTPWHRRHLDSQHMIAGSSWEDLSTLRLTTSSISQNTTLPFSEEALPSLETLPPLETDRPKGRTLRKKATLSQAKDTSEKAARLKSLESEKGLPDEHMPHHFVNGQRLTPFTKGWRWQAAGRFGGRSVDALADSGSSYNAIHQDFARSLGLSVSGPAQFLDLPSGERIRTMGVTKGIFNFAKEHRKSYELECVVLENCTHNLVLGSRFLRITETLKGSNRASRLKQVPSMFSRLNFLGNDQDLLFGYLNGSPALVVPDTGSEIMVMSPSYAARRGLKIHRDDQYRSEVQFMDGSTVLTDGMVRDVEWQFRPGDGRPFPYDFHIMSGLPVDVIVSNDFLYKFDVFTDHESQLMPAAPGELMASIYGISLAQTGQVQEEIMSLEEQAVKDLASENPFSPFMECRELARQDQIEDRIGRLPVHLQEDQRRKEEERIRHWEQKR